MSHIVTPISRAGLRALALSPRLVLLASAAREAPTSYDLLRVAAVAEVGAGDAAAEQVAAATRAAFEAIARRRVPDYDEAMRHGREALRALVVGASVGDVTGRDVAAARAAAATVAARWGSTDAGEKPKLVRGALRVLGGADPLALAVVAGLHDASRIGFGSAGRAKTAAVAEHSVLQLAVYHRAYELAGREGESGRAGESGRPDGSGRPDETLATAYQRAALLVERAAAAAGMRAGPSSMLAAMLSAAAPSDACLPPHLAATLGDLKSYVGGGRDARLG